MTTSPSRQYSPEDPYGTKGDWIRHDLLELCTGTPRRVLSLGCGTGATEQHLIARGAEVWGIDVSAEAVAAANQRGLHAMIANVEGDPLPALAPKSFDLVLCGDVLEHLRFTEHVLDRLRGWLTDDGALVLSVPNASHHSVLRQLVLHRNWKYEDAGLFDRGHYRLFTRKSLIRLLGEHGFAVEAVTSIRPLSPKLKLVWWLLGPLVWLCPALNDYFVQNWTVRARARH